MFSRISEMEKTLTGKYSNLERAIIEVAKKAEVENTANLIL